MAIINKTGITDGGTIQAEHVTRAIDALSGGSTDTIVATGSFSGSLTGIATSASFASTASFALNAGGGVGFPFTGSARITGSLAVTGSFIQTAPGLGVLINSDASGVMSLQSSTINVTSSVNFFQNAGLDLSTMSKGRGFRVPLDDPGINATTGSMYFDAPNQILYIHDGIQWTYVQLTT